MQNFSFTRIFKRVCHFVLILTIAWTGASFCLDSSARATTINDISPVVAESNPLNKLFGGGTTDRIEGKAKEDIGTVQKQVGDLQGKAEGTTKQVQGRAQRDIGKVKNRLDRAGSDLQDAAEDAGDAVKDIFN